MCDPGLSAGIHARLVPGSEVCRESGELQGFFLRVCLDKLSW